MEHSFSYVYDRGAQMQMHFTCGKNPEATRPAALSPLYHIVFLLPLIRLGSPSVSLSLSVILVILLLFVSLRGYHGFGYV